MSTIHHLKCHTEPFHKTLIGKKRAEFRKNDRDFKEGDTLVLHEYDPDSGAETGKCLGVIVEDVTPGGQYGIPEGYCVMSIV